METRQKLRQVEENQSVGEDSRRRKGKIIMQQDPPFTVLEIEDDSDEDPAPDVGSNCRYHRKIATEEGKEQTKAELSDLQDSKVRRYGMRKRSSTPDKEKDRDGKRTRSQKGKGKVEGETSRRDQGNRRKQKETVNHRIRRAEKAFIRNSKPAVRRVMQHLEEESIQEQSDEEMEEWEFLIHDPGHTRGRMSLFKQSLHIYWVMKGLMAKALEQVAKEMVALAKGGPDIRSELTFLRIAMVKQDEKLEAIQQMLNRVHPAPAEAANQQPDGDNE